MKHDLKIQIYGSVFPPSKLNKVTMKRDILDATKHGVTANGRQTLLSFCIKHLLGTLPKSSVQKVKCSEQSEKWLKDGILKCMFNIYLERNTF